MAQTSTEPTRRSSTIAFAAAGITLAAGVTIGALVGWIRPPSSPASVNVESTSGAPANAVQEPRALPVAEPASPAAPDPSAPAVVADPSEGELVIVDPPREREHAEHEGRSDRRGRREGRESREHHERGERGERAERGERHARGNDHDD